MFYKNAFCSSTDTRERKNVKANHKISDFVNIMCIIFKYLFKDQRLPQV